MIFLFYPGPMGMVCETSDPTQPAIDIELSPGFPKHDARAMLQAIAIAIKTQYRYSPGDEVHILARPNDTEPAAMYVLSATGFIPKPRDNAN